MSVANLTVGRSVSVGSLTSSNQVIGTAPRNNPGTSGSALDYGIRVADVTGAVGMDLGYSNVPAVSSCWIQVRNQGNYALNYNLAIQPNGGQVVIGTMTTPLATTVLGLTGGNLEFSTAAKGVNFTANTPAAGMTSQLLNWYEEGTWTPSDQSGAGLVFTSASGYYTRIGRTVTVVFTLVYPATASASAARIGGLPFTSANTNNGFNVGTFNTNNSGQNIQPSIVANATNFAALLVATGTSATNVQLTGATLRGGLTYFV